MLFLLACAVGLDDGIDPCDVDGDGYAWIGCEGGDDCDDAHAEVNPGAEEVWYDGVDEDCDGADDFDQDGDGYPAAADGHPADCGGEEDCDEDCDDTDGASHPGADEVCDNGNDDNCNGESDEDSICGDRG